MRRDRRAIPPRSHAFVWQCRRGLHRGARLSSAVNPPARFLAESNTPEDREYSEAADQISEVLIHAHYLSRKDIEICGAFGIADEFDTHTNFPGIEALHQTLRATYTKPSAPPTPSPKPPPRRSAKRSAPRPEWEAETLKVVMTGSAEDGPESQKHIGNKKQRRDVANQFKDAKNPFKIVIVRV